MLLNDWFNVINSESFRANEFEKAPRAEPRVARQAIPFLTWDTVVRVLSSSPADVIVARGGSLQKVERPGSESAFKELFGSGSSIVIRQAEAFDPAIRLVAASFSSTFDAPVNIHIFATPGGESGFGWHYDCEDVYLVQTAGTKEFFLRRNTVNPNPHIDRMPRDMEYQRETSEVMSCTLIPGDWLYIPSGWWHMARAHEDSLSMSIGVLMPRAGGKRLTFAQGQ